MAASNIDLTADLMRRFADSTGLSPASPRPRRYLWTDAFALCNFLELHRRTGDPAYNGLALRLVDQVHHVLGRHREDDARRGWISGLSEEEGERHPTAGGLRIGKPLNERAPNEPPDDEREWEQDGQYYHYLTKWMHALCRVGRATGDALYLRWAVELARSVHARFAYDPRSGAGKRLYWKMSIDLGRPLVPSMGQHDALDGYLTYLELQAATRDLGLPSSFDLGAEIAEMKGICRGGTWVTDDALGIGGLLFDAWRSGQLVEKGVLKDIAVVQRIVDAALPGLEMFVGSGALGLPADYRLAFRELGLSIGLRSVPRLRPWAAGRGTGAIGATLRSRIDALGAYAPLADEIERFWLTDSNRRAQTWSEHRDINIVMLATSLVPDEFLAV